MTSSFAGNPKYIDIWPRVNARFCSCADMSYVERCLNDTQIYATFAHYANLVDDRVTQEIVKLGEAPLVLYQIEGEHLWIFTGLLRYVCEIFSMVFTEEDRAVMYTYVVNIPVGPGKVKAIKAIKRKYEKHAQLYTSSLAVMTEIWNFIKPAPSEYGVKSSQHALVYVLREVLQVLTEVNRVEFAAFLDHEDVK